MNQASLARRRNVVNSVIGLSERPEKAIVWVALGLIAIEILLVGLHFGVLLLARSFGIQTADGHIGAFDLGDEATLASWLSTVQLLALGLSCLAISWFDRERLQTTPATWLWRFAAFVFVLMSIDEGSGLHEVFGKLMVVLHPDGPLTDRIWGMLPYALLLMAVFSGMILRLRREPEFMAGVVTGALLWIVGQITDQLQAFDRVVSVAVEEGLEMLGGTVLLLTFGLLLIRLARREEAPAPRA